VVQTVRYFATLPLDAQGIGTVALTAFADEPTRRVHHAKHVVFHTEKTPLVPIRSASLYGRAGCIIRLVRRFNGIALPLKTTSRIRSGATTPCSDHYELDERGLLV